MNSTFSIHSESPRITCTVSSEQS